MARKRFEFWLNDQRQEDWLVYELISKLKKPTKGQGQFTRAIREGLRLWASLRDGQVDVLLEIFPWVREALAKPVPMATVSGVGNSELAKEIAAQIILQGGTADSMRQPTSAPSQPKQIAAPNFAMPVFEDDDQPTVLIRASTNTDSSMNFVTALKNMQ